MYIYICVCVSVCVDLSIYLCVGVYICLYRDGVRLSQNCSPSNRPRFNLIRYAYIDR